MTEGLATREGLRAAQRHGGAEGGSPWRPAAARTKTGPDAGRTERPGAAAGAPPPPEHVQPGVLANAVPLLIAYLDAGLRFGFVNRLGEEYFARPAAEISGRSLSALLPPPAYETLQPWLERALAGERVRCEAQLDFPDGKRRDVQVALVPDHAADGSVRGLSAMVEDIGARKATERALEQSRERLSAILELAVDAVISVDDAERIVMFNHGAEAMFGYSAQEVLGQTLSLLLPARFHGAHRRHVQAFAHDAVPARHMNERGKLFGRRRNGEEFPAEASISRLDTGSGHIYTAIVRDVTAHVRAEAALRASEQRYRTLVNGSFQGIVIHRGARPLFVNVTFATLFGYGSPQAVLELGDLNALVAPRPDEAPPAEGAAWLEGTGLPDARVKFTGMRQDGTVLRLERYSHAVQWEGAPATQSVLLDVTEREQLEARFRQAQKMEAVGQLAAGVAHDFNNLLQVVRGYAELAGQHNANPERLESYLRQILRATEGGSHLVRQLLSFSRRDRLRPVTLDVNRVVEDVAAMLRRVIPEHIRVVLELAPDLPPLHADRALLEQMLLNLCVNARDAMREGGRLTLRTSSLQPTAAFLLRHELSRAGQLVSIDVCDTGGGIAPEVMPHIFEPFFTTKPTGQGTGLGLAMVYGGIRQHGGAVEAENRAGGGACFRLYLPEGEGAAPREAAPVAHTAHDGHETILVAEDSQMVLRLLREALEGKGYRVLTAVDGEEALAVYLANRSTVRLALLDLVMPHLGGREVYERIRRLDPHLPVLFSTGYSTRETDPDFLAEHGADIIRKPFQPAELFRRVRAALDAAAGRRGPASGS